MMRATDSQHDDGTCRHDLDSACPALAAPTQEQQPTPRRVKNEQRWDEWNASRQSYRDVGFSVGNLLEEIDTLLDAHDKLVEALRPFAALDVEAFSHFRGKSDDREVYRMNNTVITVGDVRRARAVLEQTDKGSN